MAAGTDLRHPDRFITKGASALRLSVPPENLCGSTLGSLSARQTVHSPSHKGAGLDSGSQHTASCLRWVVRPQSPLHFLQAPSQLFDPVPGVMWNYPRASEGLQAVTYAVKSSIFSAPCSCVSFNAAAYVMVPGTSPARAFTARDAYQWLYPCLDGREGCNPAIDREPPAVRTIKKKSDPPMLLRPDWGSVFAPRQVPVLNARALS